MTAGNGPSIWQGGLSRERIASATTPMLVRAHVEYKLETAVHANQPAPSARRIFHNMMVDELLKRGVLD